jgi:isoamylase
MWWGTFDFDSKYDWGRDYERPQHKLKDLIIYEMTVRCFTASKSSGLSQDKRGTYLGVAEKVRWSGWLFVCCVVVCSLDVIGVEHHSCCFTRS